MESYRHISIQNIVQAKENLDELVLWALRARGNLSRHQIMQEILVSHGFSPSPDKIDELLSDLTEKNLVEKKNNGLISVYCLTAGGHKHASSFKGRVNIL